MSVCRCACAILERFKFTVAYFSAKPIVWAFASVWNFGKGHIRVSGSDSSGHGRVTGIMEGQDRRVFSWPQSGKEKHGGHYTGARLCTSNTVICARLCCTPIQYTVHSKPNMVMGNGLAEWPYGSDKPTYSLFSRTIIHGGLVWNAFCRDALQHAHPVYHQQTLLLSGDVELNPGPIKDLCLAACKHGRRKAGEMIRCCLCAGW